MFDKWCNGGSHSFTGPPYAREVQGTRVLYFCCLEHYTAWQKPLIHQPRLYGVRHDELRTPSNECCGSPWPPGEQP